MNKEEIVKAITDDKTMPFIQPEQLSEIVDFVIKNYKPSLPSNLDEVADHYEQTKATELACKYGWGEADIKKQCFISGAEWMARQGETVEGVFMAGDPGYPDVRMGEQYSIEHILRKPGGIESGDKVVVQIRKK